MRNDVKEPYKKTIEKYLQTKERLEKALEEALLEYPSIDEGLMYDYINRLANCIRMMELYELSNNNNRLGALMMLNDTKHLEEICKGKQKNENHNLRSWKPDSV